jgi:2-dehydro-3-deoxyphosphogalactonate aldolase
MSATPSVIAILRGIQPDEVFAVADALIGAGIGLIEIPLNSPDPYVSIARLRERSSANCVIGAGTVLDVDAVDAAFAAGAKFIVAPNVNPAVIERAHQHGMIAVPGFATATEALLAVSAGATVIKLFPASTYGPNHVRALRSVLPAAIRIVAVGGIDATNIASWTDSGINGIGVGGELYRPQTHPTDVRMQAAQIVSATRLAVPDNLIEHFRNVDRSLR